MRYMKPYSMAWDEYPIPWVYVSMCHQTKAKRNADWAVVHSLRWLFGTVQYSTVDMCWLDGGPHGDREATSKVHMQSQSSYMGPKHDLANAHPLLYFVL